MRADRLVAALLLLQTRGRVTAAELAAELEVSVATARRDLEALSAAGIPVYPQAGRGGGWSLVGGARTDLTGLTAAEAQSLFLLVGPAAAQTPSVRSALRKLVRALPDTFRADAEAAAGAVVVDPAPWGGPERERLALVARLQDAVVRRRRVRLLYDGRTRERSDRLVHPWGLVDKADTWYLLAGTDDGQRTFRVDRIVEAVVTDLPAERPDDLELSDAWRRVVDVVEARRSRVAATLVVEQRHVAVLRSQFGRHCRPLAPTDDGRARLRVSAPTPLSIAQQLAGWGTLVEVADPEPDGSTDRTADHTDDHTGDHTDGGEPDDVEAGAAVRAELGRLGAELSRRYAR